MGVSLGDVGAVLLDRDAELAQTGTGTGDTRKDGMGCLALAYVLRATCPAGAAREGAACHRRLAGRGRTRACRESTAAGDGGDGRDGA